MCKTTVTVFIRTPTPVIEHDSSNYAHHKKTANEHVEKKQGMYFKSGSRWICLYN